MYMKAWEFLWYTIALFINHFCFHLFRVSTYQLGRPLRVGPISSVAEVLSLFQESDVHVTREDQSKINKFARLNAKLQDLQEEIKEKEVRKSVL